MKKIIVNSVFVSIIVVISLIAFAQSTKEVKNSTPVVALVKEKTSATMVEKRANKVLVVSYLGALGFDKRERGCAIALWDRESRFDHLADNKTSTAYGIAQLLTEHSKDPSIQVLHGVKYINHRYGGSPCRALNHSNRLGWY